MPTVERRASLIWEGNLLQGQGTIVQTSSGALDNLPVTWASRTELPAGKTSPEELLAAAHAECFAMSLVAGLARSGTPAEKLEVEAVCTVGLNTGGPKIQTMDLTVRGTVAGIDETAFEQAVQVTEQRCPVSNALRNNVEIRVHAQLNKA